MRLIIRTESLNVIESLKPYDVDFLLVEPFFSYHHPQTQSLETFKELITAVDDKRWYLEVNGFIEDNQLSALKEELKVFQLFKPQGVFFSDFAVYETLKEIEFEGEKVFSPETILTNAADIGFYLNYVDRCVLAKELTLDEICEIAQVYPRKIDVFACGHALMSVSKRPLVQNYMNEMKENEAVLNRIDIRIQEEKRPEWMPILEEVLATSVYAAKATFALIEKECLETSQVSALICDSLFIEDELFIEMIKHLLRIETSLSVDEIKSRLEIGDAYFYRKTNLLKGDKKS